MQKCTVFQKLNLDFSSTTTSGFECMSDDTEEFEGWTVAVVPKGGMFYYAGSLEKHAMIWASSFKHAELYFGDMVDLYKPLQVYQFKVEQDIKLIDVELVAV